MKNLIAIIFLGFIAAFIVSCKGKTVDAADDGSVEAVTSTAGVSQVFKVSPTASKVYWEGYKPALGTTHTGTVNVAEGKLSVKDGVIESGSFVMDMNSITDTDLQGEDKAKLEAHLKGTAPGKENDFFNVSRYPTGRFEITSVTALNNDPDGNMMIYGNLTLKEITKPIAFKANVSIQNGTLIARTMLFKIDRTEWDIKVLSKKFFDNLQDNFVDDQFGLRIELRADAGQNI